ncbi:MAG: hypothetical protein SV775_06340 [Thermodesulfobacteriota bacterium]|nr:hypothetical protein [Thermodesulfobacteriota bacterium]
MRILIADDELVSRKKMNRLIMGLGHETLVATQGAVWCDRHGRFGEIIGPGW